MRALLVTLDRMYEVDYKNYKDIQKLIGCSCFASVSWLFDNEPACYVDDEGKLNGSLPNRVVMVDGECVDIIYGSMLFCGYDPSTGDSRDITSVEIAKVRERFGSGSEGPGSGLREHNRMVVMAKLKKTKRGLVERGKI